MSSGVYFGILAMSAWGLMDFISLYACRNMDNYRALFWTQFIGLVLLAFVFPFFGHSVAIGNYLYILALDGLAVLVGYIYFYRGLSRGLVSVVSPVSSMWGAVTVVMGVLILGEKLVSSQIVAIILVLLGCLLVSMNMKDFLNFKGKKLEEGVIEGLIAMVAWGSMVVFVAPIIRDIGWFMPILISRAFTVIPLYILMRAKNIRILPDFKPSLLLPLSLIAAMDILGFVGLNMGIQAGATSIVAPVAAAYPLVTVVLAYIFYKERLAANQYVGVLAIVVGIVLLSVV